MERKQLQLLQQRLEKEPRRFIQVIYGPRQVGKTTLVRQFTDQTHLPYHFAAADAVPAGDQTWIAQQWEQARLRLAQTKTVEFLLVLDEIQKIDNWSEQVKKEWDQDTRTGERIKVILLGSSRLLIQQELSESLAGRYEATYLGHWSYTEMQEAFGFGPEEFVFFGGYPGAAAFITDEARWKSYVRDSLIESSISRDILMLTRVNKPTLMRRLFELGCAYSGQILSYNKMLGQFQDAGNTTTLSHYLHLLDTAGLLAGLEKFSPNKLRQRASSPKFQVHNTALISAQQPEPFAILPRQPDKWGRWVESAVGAHLLNGSLADRLKLSYWRHGNDEVDFVLTDGRTVVGLEVKTNASRRTSGMTAFRAQYHPDKILLVGPEGLAWQELLCIPPKELL